MKTIILTLTLTLTLLTGCANSLTWVANMYDKNDICQTREFAQDGTRLKPQGYQAPMGCGGSRSTIAVMRTTNGQQIGVITNR